MITIEELELRRKHLQTNLSSITNPDGHKSVEWKIDMITKYLDNPQSNVDDNIKYAKSDKERLFWKWIKGTAH